MQIDTSFDNTIYKKDSKGKIRFLRIYTDGNEVVQKSGVLDTENVLEHRSESKAKNIGKVNETTPAQQAILEAVSKIETKMTEGYFQTIDEAENTKVILPMLAKEYSKEKHKIVYPCYAQPKLDGMRSLGGKNKMLISRKGKEISTMSHIQADLDTIDNNDYLDGELYAHGKSFQENMKVIKKDRGAETKAVKFHVYDLVSESMSFTNRYSVLKDIVKDLPNIEIVPTILIQNEQELIDNHKLFIAAGYEGTIVRHSDAVYAIDKRDSQLLKYKDFQDIAIKILDVIPMDKNPEQGTFVFHWKGAKGHVLGDDILGCGMRFSHAERADMLKNKSDYIGKTAEVRFFEYSDDGVPRFPVTVGIRLDK